MVVGPLVFLYSRVMVGAPVTAESIHLTDLEFVCVKVPVFSFSRLRGCDPLLGVEMRSTGEVAKLSNSNDPVHLHGRHVSLMLM